MQVGTLPIEYLEPEGWFDRAKIVIEVVLETEIVMTSGHQNTSKTPGLFLWWCPPPAVAPIALEELRQQARHKRQDSSHLFVFP